MANRKLLEKTSRRRLQRSMATAGSKLWTAVYDRSSLCEETTEGSPAHHNDADGLCGFALCLRDCGLTLSEIDECAEMDNATTLVKVSKRFS